jgi:hemoglobin
MKTLLVSLLTLALCLTASAAEPPKSAAAGKECPIDGKPTDPKFATEYEGRSYTFCSEACLTKWKADRAASLYQQIGGKAAVNAAVDLFYTKVLADNRIKHYFDDVDMVRQHAKQKSFIAAALGSPVKYEGRDMRKAHAKLPGLNDTHFNAVAENLQATLVELKVPKELIDQVLAVVETTRADVLNRAK